MRAFEFPYVWNYLRILVAKIPVTMQILAGSLILALIIGTLFAIIKQSRVPVISHAARILQSYVRGTPVITQLFIIYYGLPQILRAAGLNLNGISGFWFVILTYGLNIGAAVAQNIHAGLASVGRGQREAAYTIGLSTFDTYFQIIIPQAMEVMLPNFSNIFVAALKNTSLAFSVGIMELMSQARMLGGSKYHFLESYVSAAIIYYVLYLLISYAFRLLERTRALRKGDSRI